MVRVVETELAPQSALHTHVRSGDFLDCYTVEIKRPDVPLDQIAQAVFLSFPGWIKLLLGLRNCLVSPFKLKTTDELPVDDRPRERLEAGQSLNFFPVRSVNPDEIILGEDDRHLDFKIAIRRDAGNRISLATWVHCHNLLGRSYLRLIHSFHVVIVRSQLAKMARQYS